MLASLHTLRALALLLALVPVARALFEDEVGQYEWMVQQVGQPRALAYSAEAADKIFVASESGVVASMLLKDGTVQWRRVATQHGSMRLLRAGNRGLFSVTDKSFVQAWKGSTGDLTWQREYSDGVLDLFLAGQGNKQNVVVVRESEVEVRTTAGKHEWSTPAGSGEARFWAAALTEGGSLVCALASKVGGSDAAALQIDVATGKVLKRNEVSSSVAAAAEKFPFLVVDAHIVLLSGDKISAHSLCGEGSSMDFDMRKVKTQSKTPFQLMPWQHTSGVFAATNGATTAIFGLSPKGLKHLRTFEGTAVVGPVFSVHEDEAGQPVAVATTGSEGTKIQLLDPASGNVQPAINAEGFTSTEHGPARLLLVRELSSGEHRTVMSAADHSLAGIQGSKVMWVREEALASVKQAVFFGRAKTEGRKVAAAEESGLAALLPALGAQLSQLPMYFGELLQQPARIAASISDYIAGFGKEKPRPKPTLLPNAKVPMNAEELRGFGANKFILAVTGASKLFALEATTSAIVWQRYFATGVEALGNLPAGCTESSTEIGACGLWMQLMPSTSAAYAELVVVTPPVAGGSTPGSQEIHWIDPFTGADIHSEAWAPGQGIVSVIILPRDRKSQGEKRMPFLIVDSSRHVHAMPSRSQFSAESTQLLEQGLNRFFHYEVDRKEQVVQGFAMSNKNEGQQGKKLVRMWNVELGSVGERIITAASPQHRDWDHVPVHIKGDATILYRYINPNLLAVATEDFTQKGNSTSLNLYVLDVITGHVLHQSRIVGGATPVHLVLCDNWVMMHYWNQKRTRFEITVVELFEGKADDGPWNILFGSGQGQNQTKSAHHLETPVPLQQTYIFPAGITSLGVTATLKGITPRSVIMALTTDHLYRVSKDMLNPRRPYTSAGGTQTKEDKAAIPSQFAPTKEEALPPYAPLMPLKPTDVLTYYNPVGQVAGIISSPTALESTSLIFAYGIDLFFTPVQTAKAYDVLSPGFNYKLLYASVGVVMTMLVVSSYWSHKKVLKDRWK